MAETQGNTRTACQWAFRFGKGGAKAERGKIDQTSNMFQSLVVLASKNRFPCSIITDTDYNLIIAIFTKRRTGRNGGIK